MKRYGYAFVKHPKHYGEGDELQKFLDKATEDGLEIIQVVPDNGYLTVIYYELLHTDTPEQREQAGIPVDGAH